MKKIKRRSKVRWLWCLHCCHAYPINWNPARFKVKPCPFVFCDGSEFDQIPWILVQQQNPDFPEIPEHGEVYLPAPGGVCLGDSEFSFFVVWGVKGESS